MMMVLKPTYTLRVRVQSDTLLGGKWDHFAGKTGCDEVLTEVRKALAASGLLCDVFFEKFDHESSI